MKSIRAIIQKNIELGIHNDFKKTLLAICPNSECVLAAAVKAAAIRNSVMLFAATLNQVDVDGGYTGWTPMGFIKKISQYAEHYSCQSNLYPCLDHGGPWLKDKDTQEKLNFEQTFENVKRSIESCIKAGYSLLHIDPTVDRTLPPGKTVTIEWVVDKTVELIAYAEKVREGLNLSEISYEVGTEEVHGGMVDFSNLERFIILLKLKMTNENLSHIWPCFFVAQVGTDLHTTQFDIDASKKIFNLLFPVGALAKGHYTDWVSNPGDYPKSGMGGANVGPELTAEEFNALRELELREIDLLKQYPTIEPSRFIDKLSTAVVRSERWKKWLLDDERGLDFHQISSDRKSWLLQTGSRYIWTDTDVVESRNILYKNLSIVMKDPNEFVIDRIVKSIDKYLNSFNLYNSHLQYSE
jgi:D-tagatose-1,6-bisphosphate aldolase subunit GatZ/KbaZ